MEDNTQGKSKNDVNARNQATIFREEEIEETRLKTRKANSEISNIF